MARTVLAGRSCMLALITAYLIVVPGLASAQQWQYRDLLKSIEIKVAPKGHLEAKPAETTNKDQLIDWLPSTRWHMTRGQIAASDPNITPTTTSERRDHRNADVGVALLKGRYVAQEIQYTAFFWFHENKLVAVVMKPGNPRHWPKANTGLQQIYGQPSEDNSRNISNGQMHCVVTDRKWMSERDDKIIKFNAQECNQHQHLNFYSIRYEPVMTVNMAASVTPVGIGSTGVR